ncbi:protein mono-ADP-ribosyltransferase TIPARP-like [Pseudophryne corroboree]|uniref:protein mono-ADP-ribosyltransferase TIPARP-like n=1 Tax=Pseudophryne corroboree TaxID=495146 RepID=UPI0030814A97
MLPVRKCCKKSSLTPSGVTGLEPTREEIALHGLESGNETKPVECSEALVVQETPEIPWEGQLVTIFNLNPMYHIHQNDDIDICSSYLVGRCSQFLLCPKHHTALPYVWQLRDKSTNTWCSVEDESQQVLERLYCDPAKEQVTVIYQGYKIHIDLDCMTVHNRQVFNCVRRLSTSRCSAVAFHTIYKYYYEAKGDVWQEYGPDFMKCIEEGLMDNCEEVYCKSFKFAYSLHLTDMMQINLDTGTIRRMRKRPIFRSVASLTSKLWTLPSHANTSTPSVYKFSSCLPPNSTAQCNKHKTAGSVYPNTWLITDTSLVYEKTPLTWANRVYWAVYSYFHKTMPEHKYIIHQISRVQNYFQWEKYFRKRVYMSQTPGDIEKSTLERHLFHGTNATNVEAICRQNFDPRVCNETVYGRGCYFARDACFSNTYSPPTTDGYRFMFLAKVLPGYPSVGQSTYVRPPPISAEDPASLLYDSCVNKLQSPDIFVVFDNDQFYPYFLIKYQKI